MTPSKKKEKKQAANLRARALEHFMAYGEDNSEGDGYWQDAARIIKKAKLREEDIEAEVLERLRTLLRKRIAEHTKGNKGPLTEKSDIVDFLKLVEQNKTVEEGKMAWQNKNKQHFTAFVECLVELRLIEIEQNTMVITKEGKAFLRQVKE